MKVNKYHTFNNGFGSDISSHASLLRAFFLALFILFVATAVVFGQEKQKKQDADKKSKVESKAKLEEILKEEDKLTTPEKKQTIVRMTNKKLEELLTLESKKVAGQTGNWRADYKGLPIFVITDERANRMRIISPIIEEGKLTAADLKKLMEANFDKALDAKYSIYQGFLWSTYAHPLGELTDEQFKDALQQVFNLVGNYGTSYSSTGVIFGAAQEAEKEVFN